MNWHEYTYWCPRCQRNVVDRHPTMKAELPEAKWSLDLCDECKEVDVRGQLGRIGEKRLK